MSDDSDDPGGIIMQGPSDPDAQATVTDFIDYTEYLPSDIVRSLTLIRGLDESYLDAAASVHELTKNYGLLPDMPAEERPDPLALRKQISEQLERALNARESAYAESCRLYDIVDRHFDRLGSIKSKLLALASTLPAVKPEEASKDTKRTKGGRKIGETAPTPRLTLRVDGARQSGAVGASGDKTASQRGRQRGAAPRAGHLASFNPDSPVASTEQSDEETRPGPVLPESSKGPEKGKPVLKIVQKKSAPGKNRKVSHPGEGKRPGYIGRTPIELSTSNALAMLKPPPEDAKIGSEHLPWLRLSVWEMTTLRKKMKKNNIWQPSEIMVQRELAVRGRGWENYQAAKAQAEAAGTEFIDCDDISNNKAVGGGPTGSEDLKPSNRGMKLNEAKKSKQMKRENAARGQAEQAALAAAEAEMAARRLGDIGSTFKSLFSSPAEQSRYISVQQQQQHGVSNDPFNANSVSSKDRENAKQAASKKRKLEETSAPETGQAATTTSSSIKPAPKKLKLTKHAPKTADETALPEATAATPKPPAPTSRRASPSTTTIDLRRPASAHKAQPTPPPISATRASSRPRSAASLDSAGRERLRIKSATPAVRAPTPKQATTATSGGRRSKRPAPGPVTAGQDGGSAVSVGHRKAKPSLKKKKDMSHKDLAKEGLRIDEDGVLEEIDPNEPRYCLCGDVSFGTMICCEDNDCDKEWFHLDCVGLSEVPSRTAKWYCPECRKKLGKDFPDGIVRSGNRR